jgi:hypothetical protein
LSATPRGDSRGPSATGKRLDGFNEGWIDFKGEKATVLYGQMNVETLLGALALETGGYALIRQTHIGGLSIPERTEQPFFSLHIRFEGG